MPVKLSRGQQVILGTLIYKSMICLSLKYIDLPSALTLNNPMVRRKSRVSSMSHNFPSLTETEWLWDLITFLGRIIIIWYFMITCDIAYIFIIQTPHLPFGLIFRILKFTYIIVWNILKIFLDYNLVLIHPDTSS